MSCCFVDPQLTWVATNQCQAKADRLPREACRMTRNRNWFSVLQVRWIMLVGWDKPVAAFGLVAE